MPILVTGGTGSIGSALVRRLLVDPSNVVRVLSRNDSRQHELIFSLSEEHRSRLRCICGDVANPSTCKRAVHGCSVVFHCAAMKHLWSCEYSSDEATRVNAQGTANILDALHGQLAAFILLSTDKVIEPSSALGMSKGLAERNAIGMAHWLSPEVRVAVCRFGNVWNTSGSVLPTFVKAIERGMPIEIRGEGVTRYIMSKDQAVDCLLKAKEMLTWHQKKPIILTRLLPTITVDQIAVVAEEITGSEATIVKKPLLSSEKIHEALIDQLEINRVCQVNTARNYYIVMSEDPPDEPAFTVDSSVIKKLRSSANADKMTTDQLLALPR